MSSDSSIAIVGMSGRFPGARDVQQFWGNLKAGVESISFFSREEAAADGVPPAIADHPEAVFAGGVLEDLDRFDAAFFGITPKEAEIMDPQQRVFLETAWAALEDAGYDSQRYSGRIGVFASVSASKYFLELAAHPELIAPLTMFQALVDNDKDHLATRTSYKLDLRGPSLVVQTACSSSLVAVHLACSSLLSGESDACLVGAASVKFLQKPAYVYKHGGIGSPDGHCRAFDADARGMVSGDGVAVVMLKRLPDAIADNDHIYAVVLGSAINNDGSGKVGFTAPSVDGEREAIVEAHAVAGVNADTIGYVEAHGTGTALGDPIEIEAITKAFGPVKRKGYCAIGSVKTNIGHLDAAAGVTGLIKAALTVQEGVIPPSLHFVRPNPHIDFENSPFFVNDRLRPLPRLGPARLAGVSSFGIGGTNAHVVLEEPPQLERTGPLPGPHILALSAKTESALDRMAANLADHLDSHPDLSLADVSNTLLAGRRLFEYRLTAVVNNTQHAVELLRGRTLKRSRTGAASRPVCFLFPGQGTQYIGMAADLFEQEPMFRHELEQCSELLRTECGMDIMPILFPIEEKRSEAADLINRTEFAQPILFAVELSLAKLWIARGVKPEAMVGHSIGEYVAACLSGVLSLQDALRVVVQRGRLMQSLPGGAMAAIPLGEAEVAELTNGDISIAALNGPRLTVVSGENTEIQRLVTNLQKRGIDASILRTSHAFHSHMMIPALKKMHECMRGVRLSPPKIPYLSNVTGDWIQASEAQDPNYWAIHLRQTVRFPGPDSNALRSRPWMLLEVGPGRSLSRIFSGCEGLTAVSTLPRQSGSAARQGFYEAIAELWRTGVRLDSERLFTGKPRRVSLPAYPFEGKRYCIQFSWRRTRNEASTPAGLDALKKPTTIPNSRLHSILEAQQNLIAKQSELLRRFTIKDDAIPLLPVQRSLLESVNPSHWNQSALFEMLEHVEPAHIETAFQEITRVHDSFRLRFLRRGISWSQSMAPVSGSRIFSVETAASEEELTATCERLKLGLNLEAGPLLRAALIQVAPSRRAYLFITAHHLVVDLHSWRILIEDLEQGLRLAQAGRPLVLQSPRSSFADAASAIWTWAQSPAAESELHHWTSVDRRRSGHISRDWPEGANTFGSADVITSRLSSDIGKPGALECCLSGFGSALLKWTELEAVLVNLESHGREQVASLDLAQTTGCFTSMHPILFTRRSVDSGDVRACTSRQLRSVAHGGLSYGALRYLNVNPTISSAMRSCPEAQVGFNLVDHSRPGNRNGRALFKRSHLPTGADRNPSGQRERLIDCTISVTQEHATAEIYYSRGRHRRASIENLVRMTADSIGAMVHEVRAGACGHVSVK